MGIHPSWSGQSRASSPTEYPYLGIMVDPARDARLSDQSKTLLGKFYLRKSEKPQEGFARACVAWATYKGATDFNHAQRLYDYVSRGWFGFASPVLSNAPLPGEKARGMPISCFAGFVPDTIPGLVDHSTEFRWLSISGGGVGGHWSAVRSVSDKAPGPIPFIKTMDSDAAAYRQGITRKGSYAAYLDVSHPDIVEFIQLRVPTGDEERKCLGEGFHNAVNITDAFMNAVLADASWELVDPHTKEVKETVRAKYLWELMLETRVKTGEPYLNFIDAANRALPEAQKAKGLRVHGSNLCNEIHLPTGIDYNGVNRTFVCCLSSINYEAYPEWGPTAPRFVGDLIRMLDNILEFFIENAPQELGNARYSASMERALGLGPMGVHSLMQRMGMAWESQEAVAFDAYIQQVVQDCAILESRQLAVERGEAPDMVGTGLRNSHLLSAAPTANNASIIGTSPGVELWKANVFRHSTRAGVHLIKNKYLEAKLESMGRNTEEVWLSIMGAKGSVQHLDFLDAKTKEVFKTAIEVDQTWVVKHAAARQKYICQGQSLNLFFAPGADRAYVNKVHLLAWKTGCKGLYYYRTEARNRADNVSLKIERVALKDAVQPSESSCLACEG